MMIDIKTARKYLFIFISVLISTHDFNIFRHVADLGNVEEDVNGEVHTTITDNVIQLQGPYSVIGRTVVVNII